jgi:hypothetical protein
MSSDAIEEERSRLEVTPIFSPSMPTLDNFSEPIFNPILDPYDFSYALFLTHDDQKSLSLSIYIYIYKS